MNRFDFHPTTRVLFGENTVDELGRLAKSFSVKRVLLVSDPGIMKAGHLKRALDSLNKESLNTLVYHDVKENPTTADVEQCVQFAREGGNIELIVALGGGSAMDCAKGVNFLLTNGGKMEDYWGIGKATRAMLPSIGIPTTAGTGSEAQSFALISQVDTHRKMACGDKKARFTRVILDPVLLRSVPRQVAIATGLDAISHALESYVSTRHNAISQLCAREAWRFLEQNFEIILKEPQNVNSWSQMLLGAHLAGMAIENSMLGAAHACANPLTARFGIVHGIAVSLMLPQVMTYNAVNVKRLYGELSRAAVLNGSAPAAENLIQRVRQLIARAEFPNRLRDFGVEEAILPQLAKDASEQWTGKFNPRPVNEEALFEMYRAVY